MHDACMRVAPLGTEATGEAAPITTSNSPQHDSSTARSPPSAVELEVRQARSPDQAYNTNIRKTAVRWCSAPIYILYR